MPKISFRNVSFIKTKHFNILGYGFYYALGGFLVLQLFFIHWYRLKGAFSPSFPLFFALLVPLSTVIFSKVLYLLYNCKRLLKTPLTVLNETGYAFFGGFAGILFSLWMLERYFYPGDILALLDLMFISFPVAQIFQRVGCMTYGCCYGHDFSGPLSVVYPNADYKAYRNVGSTPVHNTQFYSLLKNIVVLVVVNAAFFKLPYYGIALSFWLIMCGSLRFFVDFTRFVQPPYIFGFRITQLISVLIFLIGVLYLLNIELVPYQFSYTFWNAFIKTLPLIRYSLLGFIILLIAYGYHSKIIGYYLEPRNLRSGNQDSNFNK